MGACLDLRIIAGCIFLPLGQVLQWTSVQIMQHLPQLHWQPEEQSAVQTVRNASSWLSPGAWRGTIVVARLRRKFFFAESSILASRRPLSAILMALLSHLGRHMN